MPKEKLESTEAECEIILVRIKQQTQLSTSRVSQKKDEVMKSLGTLKSLHIKYAITDNPCKIRLESIKIN